MAESGRTIHNNDGEVAGGDQPAPKRFKPESLIHESLKNFAGFKVKEVLGNNASSKTVFLHCSVGTPSKASDDDDDNNGDSTEAVADDAVIILEKAAFSDGDVEGILTDDTLLKQQLHNDIYGTYSCTVQPQFNCVKATVIHPCTPKHIEKYRFKDVTLITETYREYLGISKPWIEQQPASGLEWVENILNHKSEEDRIVFEDPDPNLGFVLLPDMKWDRKNIKELYLVAIVHRKGLKTIRDLDSSHLPLLRNIKRKSLRAIADTFGVQSHHLRVFFHYQPSYYHLHVHFTHVRAEGAVAAGVQVERAHLLDAVIGNLELIPKYYQLVKMAFLLKEGDPLLQRFKTERNNKDETDDGGGLDGDDDDDDDDDDDASDDIVVLN